MTIFQVFVKTDSGLEYTIGFNRVQSKALKCRKKWMKRYPGLDIYLRLVEVQ